MFLLLRSALPTGNLAPPQAWLPVAADSFLEWCWGSRGYAVPFPCRQPPFWLH